MAWGNEPEPVAEVVTTLEPPLDIAARDQAILAWTDAKTSLGSIKELEMMLRTNVSEMLFPDPKKGTQRYDLGAGYKIKLVHGWTYTLGDKTNQASIRDQVDKALDDIAALGDAGELIAASLVRWKPELSTTEYEKLSDANATDTQLKAKAIIDAILTVKAASPTLELETPK